MASCSIVDVELGGVPGQTVVVRDGLIAAIGGPAEGEVFEGRGAALLPGFHDHHCHLLAVARAAGSVQLAGVTHLRAALAGQAGEWIRAVGYDGDLDREALDAVSPPGAKVRVQHRGGSVWFLNSAAIEALGLGDHDGRLWRSDAWLAEQDTGPADMDLPALGERLASYGVTGVSDATPGLDAEAQARLTAELPQKLVFLNKIVVSDHDLPGLDDLTEQIRTARQRGPVAIHSVTAESLWLTLAALADAGPLPGDRIEHAAVAPPEALAEIKRLGLVVCTQPSLISTRGDDYLDQADDVDRLNLWRHESFVQQGIPVLLSSDAPYGDLDPLATVRSATTRLTPSGRVLGEHERVSEEQALAGFLAAPLWPHDRRRVAVGEPADLVLVEKGAVRATFIDGEIAYDAG